MNISTGASYDIADRLPPGARERLDAIRERSTDARAATRARFDEIAALLEERRDLEGRRRTLVGNQFDAGFGLKPDHVQVVSLDKNIARLNAAIQRVKQIEADRGAIYEAANTIQRVVEDWLSGGVPRGCTICDAIPVDAGTLLKKGEAAVDAVARLQRRGLELAADLHRTRSAPHPSDERKAAMRQQVERWAEAGAPNVSASIALGHDIEFETESVQVDVHSDPRALGFLEQINPIAVLAWFDKDRLIARLDAAIDEEANDGVALTDADREKQEAVILGDILANDRDECVLIEVGRAQGIMVEYRAETSPLALLGVDLVTSGRSSPTSKG